MSGAEDWMKRAIGGFFRLAERILPVGILHAFLWPFAAVVGLAELIALSSHSTSLGRLRPLPPALVPAVPWWLWGLRLWSGHVALALSRFHRLWPDRLSSPRWAGRCRVTGPGRLEEALATGRPVILATLHYGGIAELHHRLRAMGLAAASLVSRDLDEAGPYRKELEALADRANGLQGVPRLFAVDQLWEARDFLGEPSRILMTAIEQLEGSRHAVLARGPGFGARLSAGVFRIAAIVNAIVLPCLISQLDPPELLGCRIHFGVPVPDECVARRDLHQAGCDHIFGELAPWLLARPELCLPQLSSALQPLRRGAPR